MKAAAPAKLRPPVPAKRCLCAPDPLLPSPACILCYCPNTAADLGIDLLVSLQGQASEHTGPLARRGLAGSSRCSLAHPVRPTPA